MGVRQVALPIQGKGRARQRWFRKGLRWRTGCEGRISVEANVADLDADGRAALAFLRRMTASSP